MLDFLRKRKRNWIIILFLGAIIVSFALFVGSGNLGDPRGADVATINDEPITQREFAISYERELQRYRDLLKGSLTPEMLKGLNIKGNLIETLIQKKLALQEARRLGLTVSDDELAAEIGKVPDFQIGGRFSKDRYLRILQANRLAPAQFEEEQRDQLTIQRLYNLILDAVHITDAELRERYRIEQERINLAYVKLAVSDFMPEVKLSEEEIQKHYERTKESLKEPLKVRLEYLAYPYAQFTPQAEVSGKEIEDYYKTHRDAQFHKPKEVKLRYILIGGGADAEQKQATQARAAAIVEEARGGKDFAQLAKSASSDGSAAKGGDVGWISAGQMPPEMEKSVFALPKGGISDPLESPAGFQIFKVEDVREAKTLSLQEARPEIVERLKLDKAKRQSAQLAVRDREKALSGTDFAALAKESGASLLQTRLFATGETLPEIGDNQTFYKTAFSLGAKDISPLIEGKDAYYLMRLKERKEAAVPPVDQVRGQIEKGLRESKAYELALQRANALLEQLKKEQDLAKVAQAAKLRVEETGWFPRSAPQIPKIGELSEMKTGPIVLSEERPVPEKVFTQKDAVYVVAFKSGQAAEMAEFDKNKDAIKRQALAETKQRALVKFMEGLKSKANVTLNNAFLEEA
jgi:peptidyl-prolyl cis-trans isomerase D